MYAHPSTQKNLDTLRSYGNHIIEPATGELASHLVGKGRMEEPENIIRHLEDVYKRQPDFREQMLRASSFEKIDGVLVTHEHYDHVGCLLYTSRCV